MNKTNIIMKVTFVLSLIFVCLSFAPCIKIITHMIPQVVGDTRDIVTVSDRNYVSNVCVIFTLLEVALLIVFPKRGFRVVGFLLNLAKTFLPYHLVVFLDSLMNSFGGLSWNEYSLSALGYVLIVVGILISACYIILFFLESTFRHHVNCVGVIISVVCEL